MNQQLESQAIFKIIRIFIVQYLASIRIIFFIRDNYNSIQNESINILATHVLRSKFPHLISHQKYDCRDEEAPFDAGKD